MADGRKLHASRFQSAELARNVWRVAPEHGVTPEDMAAPVFWSHVASQMRAFDRIEAIAEDSSWFAEFIVLAVQPVQATVALLRKVDLAKASIPGVPFAVEFRGPHSKFAVVRVSDKAILKDQFATNAEALKWAAENNAGSGGKSAEKKAA